MDGYFCGAGPVRSAATVRGRQGTRACLSGEARPENFPMVNDYRNPIVAEAMKEMKYVNMFNQGVKRVQDMLRENGNREAVFDVSKLTVFCVDVFFQMTIA